MMAAWHELVRLFHVEQNTSFGMIILAEAGYME